MKIVRTAKRVYNDPIALRYTCLFLIRTADETDNIVDSVSVLEHINKTIKKLHSYRRYFAITYDPNNLTIGDAIKNDANFLIDFVIGNLMVAKSRIRLLMNPDGFFLCLY